MPITTWSLDRLSPAPVFHCPNCDEARSIVVKRAMGWRHDYEPNPISEYPFVGECGYCGGGVFGYRSEWRVPGSAEWGDSIISPTGVDVPRSFPLFGSGAVMVEYEAALGLLAKREWSSTVVKIRSCLEAQLTEMGSGNGSLFKQIEQAKRHGVVGAMVAGQMHKLREVGNKGAHGDIVHEHDARWAVEVMSALLVVARKSSPTV